MNEAHLHLLVNHFPVVGAIVSLVALIVALAWSSEDFRKSALIIALIFGLSAIPAYFSGEAAEEIAEEANASHERIESHEDAAKLATIAAIVSGLVAGGALALRNARPVGLSAAAFLFLITAILMARAANSGGQIAHPEIRGDTSMVSPTTRNYSPSESDEKQGLNREEEDD